MFNYLATEPRLQTVYDDTLQFQFTNQVASDITQVKFEKLRQPGKCVDDDELYNLNRCKFILTEGKQPLDLMKGDNLDVLD